MTVEQKEAVIARIASAFNARGLTWAAAASYMLFKRGVVDAFNDLDIVVALEDAGRADALLRTLGNAIAVAPNAGYETDFFGKYEVDGLGVDLMGGFSVVTGAGVFNYLFDKAAAPESADVGGVHVPLARLGDWFVLYSLMQNRESRVAQIRAFYAHNPPLPDEMLETALFASFGLLPQGEGLKKRQEYIKDARRFAASQ